MNKEDNERTKKEDPLAPPPKQASMTNGFSKTVQTPPNTQPVQAAPCRELSITCPGPFDVICARGKLALLHPGNLRYKKLVQQILDEYENAHSKLHKSQIVTRIADTIRRDSPAGGFIKQINGKWHEVGDHVAREKIGQSIRDALHQNYKSSTKAKSLKKRQHRDVAASLVSLSKQRPDTKTKERKVPAKVKAAVLPAAPSTAGAGKKAANKPVVGSNFQSQMKVPTNFKAAARGMPPPWPPALGYAQPVVPPLHVAPPPPYHPGHHPPQASCQPPTSANVPTMTAKSYQQAHASYAQINNLANSMKLRFNVERSEVQTKAESRPECLAGRADYVAQVQKEARAKAHDPLGYASASLGWAIQNAQNLFHSKKEGPPPPKASNASAMATNVVNEPHEAAANLDSIILSKLKEARVLKNFKGPGQFDVICARGDVSKNHFGNKLFRNLVQDSVEDYFTAETESAKSLVVSRIVEVIRKLSPEGGFVRQDQQGTWYDVGDQFARNKITQVFRDVISPRQDYDVAAKQQGECAANPFGCIKAFPEHLKEDDAAPTRVERSQERRNVSQTATNHDTGKETNGRPVESEVAAQLVQLGNRLSFPQDPIVVKREIMKELDDMLLSCDNTKSSQVGSAFREKASAATDSISKANPSGTRENSVGERSNVRSISPGIGKAAGAVVPTGNATDSNNSSDVDMRLQAVQKLKKLSSQQTIQLLKGHLRPEDTRRSDPRPVKKRRVSNNLEQEHNEHGPGDMEAKEVALLMTSMSQGSSSESSGVLEANSVLMQSSKSTYVVDATLPATRQVSQELSGVPKTK